MKPLLEKYRPATLSEIKGQASIVANLKRFVAKPTSKAFIFSGQPGTGKTSAAHALAKELGCDVEKKEWGGLHEIASGELTAENVREMFGTTLRYSAWSGSGWKVVICNEADNMSDKAAFIFLDVLEKLPSRVVVVFTTNNSEKLSRRFRERCELCSFKSQVSPDLESEAQALIDDVWQSELGHNHSPRLAELSDVVENGQISFRAVVRALEPLIRAQAEIDGTLAPVVPKFTARIVEKEKPKFTARVVTREKTALEIMQAAFNRSQSAIA